MLSSPYTHTVPMTKANAPSENVVNAQTLVSNIQKLIQKMEKKIDDKAFRNVQREFCKLLTETTRALSTQNSFLESSMEERNKHAYRPIHTNNNFIDTSKQQQERREENEECGSVKVGVEDKHVSRKLYRARSAASERTYSRNGLTQSSHDARIQKGKNMFDDHNDTVLRNSLDGASPIFTPLQRPSTTATASLEQLQKENNLEHVRCHEEVQTEQTELHRPLAATTRITTTRTTNSLLLESENNNNNNHERLQSTEERRSGAKTQIDTYKSNAPLHHKTRLLSTLMYSPSPQSCSTAITAVALESVLSTSASSLSPANSSTSSSLSPLM